MTVPPLDPAPVQKVALIAAVGGFAAWGVLAAVNFGGEHGSEEKYLPWQDLFTSYLVGWVFWAAIPFGAMALIMIGYLTSASWGVVLRRCFQAATRTLPLMAVLFIPIVASLYMGDREHGPKSPFWWNDQRWEGEPESVAKALGTVPDAVEEVQHKKHGYDALPVITGQNPAYFIGRALIVFGVLGGIIFLLNKWGRRAEDADDPNALYNLKGLSGPGIIFWALILTMGLTDWVMSVEPTWASSMFPVVFGMNAFICTFSVSILTFYSLYSGNEEVMGIVKNKFRIDMGTLLLGFTMVWAYASFCQYMLIWAGNLPEELIYYRKRGEGGWEYLAYFLMAFHWLFPFIVLLFREVKTSPAAMRRMTILLLTVCAADVVWWIVPAIPHPHGGLHAVMAAAAIVGVGGVWGLLFARELGRRPILPTNSEGRFLANWGHGH
jgi:hypothetical protein